jgi:hypothetical protein
VRQPVSHLLPIALVALVLAGQGAAPAPLKVLFIGNSLTTANDVPALLEAVAKANGQHIVTGTVAYPNYSLEDHWQKGDAQRAIAHGGWSFVVLQQGPSALPESRTLLVDFAKRYALEAKRVNARVALYMVWPASQRAFDFDGVKLSYETAARDCGGIFLPAGEAWRAARRLDASLVFYGPDGFHPTPLASYLCALVIYQGLTGKSPAQSGYGPVSSGQAKLLRQAASLAFGHSVK